MHHAVLPLRISCLEFEQAAALCRPAMLEFRSCTDVAVSGLTFVNSPWWTIHPFNCSGFRCPSIASRQCLENLSRLAAPCGCARKQTCAQLKSSSALSEIQPQARKRPAGAAFGTQKAVLLV